MNIELQLGVVLSVPEVLIDEVLVQEALDSPTPFENHTSWLC